MKKVLCVTIGYQEYVISPQDFASLMEINERMTPVKKGSDWLKVTQDVENKDRVFVSQVLFHELEDEQQLAARESNVFMDAVKEFS